MFISSPIELLLLRFREAFALKQVLFIFVYNFLPHSGLQGLCQLRFGLYTACKQTFIQLRLIEIFVTFYCHFIYLIPNILLWWLK